MLIFSAMALTAGIATTGPSVGSASAAVTAPATPTPRTVCLTNASTQCADVKDSNDTAGTRVWLYDKSQANDDKWIEVANPSCFIGAGCIYFEDAQNTSLCMSATGTGGAYVELENCEDRGSWYNEGSNILGNGFYGAAGNLGANGSASKDYVRALNNAAWHQWNW
jgi:hypothetical protein